MHIKFNTFFTANETLPSHFPLSKNLKSNSSNDLSCFHRDHKQILNTHGEDKSLNHLIKIWIRCFITVTSPPAGSNGELQKEMAELHHKSNIPSNQRGNILAMDIKVCSKAVAKTDIKNIDEKICYTFQTLLLTYQ